VLLAGKLGEGTRAPFSIEGFRHSLSNQELVID
jgi:hypothetical protein